MALNIYVKRYVTVRCYALYKEQAKR